MTRGAFLCAILATALSAVASVGAMAQSVPPGVLETQSPPIGMKGWRYDKGGAGAHRFRCEPPVCASKSTVVYLVYTQREPLTFDKYRIMAEPTTRSMESGNTEGARFETLGVEDESKTIGTLSLRLYKTRRLMTPATGPKQFITQGYLHGSRYAASISSYSDSEETAEANFTQFAAGLWLYVDDRLEKQR